MMSLYAIRHLNTQIGLEAAERGLVPYVPFDSDEVSYWPPIPFPSLGYLQPDGWKRTDALWFVDKNGHGRPDELALTCDQFKRELVKYIRKNPDHGFGVVEEGESQVFVAAFRRAV